MQLETATAEAGRLERRADELDRTILQLHAARSVPPSPAHLSLVPPSAMSGAPGDISAADDEEEDGRRDDDDDDDDGAADAVTVDALRVRVATLEGRLRAAAEGGDEGLLLGHIADLEAQVDFLREQSASAQRGTNLIERPASRAVCTLFFSVLPVVFVFAHCLCPAGPWGRFCFPHAMPFRGRSLCAESSGPRRPTAGAAFACLEGPILPHPGTSTLPPSTSCRCRFRPPGNAPTRRANH